MNISTLDELMDLIDDSKSILITTDEMKKVILANSDGFRHHKIITKSEFYNSLLKDKHYVKLLITNELLEKMSLNFNYDLVNRLYNLLVFSYINNTGDELYKLVDKYDLFEIPRIYRALNVYFLDVESQYSDIIEESTVLNVVNQDKDISVNEFIDEFEEIGFVAQSISELISKGTSLDNIGIYTSYDELKINLIFNMYNLFYKQNNEFYLSRESDVSRLILELKENKYSSIEDIYENYKDNEKIVNILNNYVGLEDFNKLLIGELESTKVKSFVKANNINNINVPIINKEFHLFVLGYNKGEIIRPLKENKSISSNQQKLYNLDDESVLTRREISKFKTLVNASEVVISYSKVNDNKVEDLFKEPEIIKNEFQFDSYSFNNVLYKKNYEQMVKYNNVTRRMKMLSSLDVKVPEKNKYAGFNDKKVVLSASSIETYLKCPFRFYLRYILKMSKIYDDSQIVFGNLIHKILEDYYNGVGNIDDLVEKILTNDEYSHFMIFKSQLKMHMNLLIEELDDQSANSRYSVSELEREFTIDYNDQFVFKGKIDKILSLGNNKVIVDYKTGNSELKLNNILNYFDIQNFIYIHFLKKIEPESNFVATFRQKVKLAPSDKLTTEDNVEQNTKLDGLIAGEFNVRDLNTNLENYPFIKGVRLTNSGEFYKNSFVEYQVFEEIDQEIEKLINQTIEGISNNEYPIIDYKDYDKNKFDISCKYCEYSDICFKNKNDIKVIKEKREC